MATLTNISTLAAGTTLVVGLGKTGVSIARFLAGQGEMFAVADSRTSPPGLDEFRTEFPEVALYLGEFAAELFQGAARIVLSPGVPLQEPAVQAALAQGVSVLGDIELFAQHVDAPVVAITGSNGKSTVTTLLGEMAIEAGLKTRVGGNLGMPALDLLRQSATEGAPQLYVLELSSFQLETTNSLNCRAATVLNLSSDHLDRHAGMTEYAAIKQRIFTGNGVMVLNADDAVVRAMAESDRDVRWFALQQPGDAEHYGLSVQGGRQWLCRGDEHIVATDELKLAGRHNWANALAAIALGDACGLPRAAMLSVLRRFTGLPHRCQWVAQINGVDWYDDSKGTNVGSTLAALTGMPGNKVVLIAGGDGKGQDFSPLRAAVAAHARAVVLIGRDAPLIAQAIGQAVPLVNAGSSMQQAVSESARLALPGDCVLLSPACASFDMFNNYEHRAEVFVGAVKELAA